MLSNNIPSGKGILERLAPLTCMEDSQLIKIKHLSKPKSFLTQPQATSPKWGLVAEWFPRLDSAVFSLSFFGR